MTSIYGAIHRSCHTAVANLPALAGLRVVRRQFPELLPAQDKYPCVVVATRRGMLPRLAEYLLDNRAVYAHDVYVGLATERRFDDDALDFRHETLEAIRQGLSVPTLLAGVVPGEYDFDYDPDPPVPALPADLENRIDVSWQLWKWKVVTQRSG